MVQDAVTTAVRFGAGAAKEVAQFVVDLTLGRLLDTDPDGLH